MTLVIIFAAGFTLGLITVAASIPVPIPGDGGNQRLIQVFQSGTLNAAMTTPTNSSILPGDCIPIENTGIPTTIILGPQTPVGSRSYRLLGYPVNCSYAEVPPLPPSTILNFTNGTIIVNRRHPICSFKVGNILPGSKIDVKFFGQVNKDNQTVYNETVADETCVDMCASTPWDPYVKMVEILEHGRDRLMANNPIRIFSGTGSQKCGGEIAEEAEIGHGANLARLSLVEPGHFVQSFTVLVNN